MQRIVCVFGLTLGVTLLAGCAKPKPTTAQIDPALAILIPPDTNLIVGAHMEALRKTPLYQKHIAAANIPPLADLEKYTGIDARKDLWELLFVSDGSHGVLLARGNFAGEMETKLEREGAKIIPHKMYHIIGNEQAAVVFFNASAAGVGSVDSLRSLIDARGKTNGPPAAIAERMKEVPADAQLWAVSIGGGRSMSLPLPGIGGSMGMPMDSGVLYLDLRDGVKGQARATSTTPEYAKQLHDSLKGLIGFGRLSAPAEQPELLRAFDGLQVAQDKNAVSVKIDEPADLVEKLVEYAQGAAGVGRLPLRPPR